MQIPDLTIIPPAQFAAEMTRDEIEAHSRALSRVAAHNHSSFLAQFALDLAALAPDAAPIQTAHPFDSPGEAAIYLGPVALDTPGGDWFVAVMSEAGTHHLNEWPTRDAALIYIAHVRLNWPALTAIEVVA